MKNHVVKVLKSDFLNPGVKRFVVKRPTGYEFIPGQATTISINEPRFTNILRPFSFTSNNKSNFLEFIIKIYPERHGVTKKLLEVRTGDELILHKVFGTIRYLGPGLFIAGGMGITPFIAILRQLELQGSLAGNSLLFANRTATDIILKDELQGMLGNNYVNVLETTSDPTMKNGFIGSKLLKQYATPEKSYFYICGPEKFNIITIKHLLTIGIEKSRIIIERDKTVLAYNSVIHNQLCQFN